MTLQTLRSIVEQPVIQALASAVPPVPVNVANQFRPRNDALTEFADVRVQWGETTTPAIGCAPSELMRGVLVVELFTAKGDGPGRAQDVITPVLQALAGFNRLAVSGTLVTVGPVNGPSFTALDQRPYFMTRITVPVRGRVN